MPSPSFHPPATPGRSFAATQPRHSTGRRAWAALSLAMLTGVCAAPALALAHSVVGATPDDLALANRVQAALLADTAFQTPLVDLAVRAEQGQVNLSGWLSHTDNDPRARVVAAGVPGVSAVTSNFKSWSTRTDPRLHAR